MTRAFVKSFPRHTQMVFVETVLGAGLPQEQGSSESRVTLSPMGENANVLVFIALPHSKPNHQPLLSFSLV